MEYTAKQIENIFNKNYRTNSKVIQFGQSINNPNLNSGLPTIIELPDEQETAIVTRKKVPVSSSGGSFKNFSKNLTNSVSNLINNSTSKFKKKR